MDSAGKLELHEDLARVNRLWRERYLIMWNECNPAEKFTALQTAFDSTWRELRQLKDSRPAWNAFLKDEADALAKASPESNKLEEQQQAWIQKISCQNCSFAETQNDWTWLASILSSPDRFADLTLAKHRNQHIAIYRQQVLCGANTRSEAVRVATEIIQTESGEIVNPDDIVVYFL